MGTFDDWFKPYKRTKKAKVKSTKKIKNISTPSPSNYPNDKILNEPWIEHYFAFQWDFPKGLSASQLEKAMSEFNLNLLNYMAPGHAELENINNEYYIMTRNYFSEILKSSSCKWYHNLTLPPEYAPIRKYKNINLSTTYFLLIRFPSVTKLQAKKGFNGEEHRKLPPNLRRDYKFSPLQSIKYREFSDKLGFIIYKLLEIKLNKGMSFIERKNKDVIITAFNGSNEYYNYPLSKRAELYVKYPEIEKKIFGETFLEFIKKIFTKNPHNYIDDVYDAEIINNVKEIIKKYNL